MRSTRPGIAVIEQPMPGHLLAATNCYVIATDGGALVIDPGYKTPGGLERIELGLSAIQRGFGDVQIVMLTHSHRDHSESAETLRERTGAVVAMHPHDWVTGSSGEMSAALLRSWGVPDDRWAGLIGRKLPHATPSDFELVPGVELPTSIGLLRVVHAPGHTAGSVCFAIDDANLIFTGDHVLPDLNPGAGLGGSFTENPLRQYLRSLKAMEQFEGYEGYPGHGASLPSVNGRARDIADHHRRRTREVLGIVRSQPTATVWEIAERVRWGGGFHSLEGGRLVSALRQTLWHRELAEELE